MTGESRYRAAPFEAVKGRQGNRVLLRPDGERRIVPEGLFALLDQLRGFRTLAEHAVGRDPAARPALESLRRDGLLVSEEEFFAAAIPDDPPAPEAVTVIGIPARSDSPVLRRALLSFEESARRFGHSLRFVVTGERGKGELASSLANIDPVITRFALFGEAPGLPPGLARDTGANRNALFLACPGEAFLSVDDDVICSLTRHPGGHGNLSFRSGGSPREIWFASDLSSFVPDPDIDLFRATGRGFGPAVREQSPLAASEMDHEGFARLMTGQSHCPVVATGLIGDAATNSPVGWLTASGATRERLVATEKGYREAMSSRRIFAVAPDETLVDYPTLMMYCTGLDNRVLLPPFPPLGRDQDGIFALWLRLADPLAFIRDLPFAISHEPEEVRSFDPDSISRPAPGIILNDVLRLILDAAVPPMGLTPEQRLIWIGHRLIDAAVLLPAEFEALLAAKKLQFLSRAIEYCERALTAFGSKPAWWARDIQALVRGYEQAMADPGMLRLAEPGGIDPDPEVIRTYVRWCGRLLVEWPAIRQASISGV